MENQQINWNGPEHSHKERGGDWYVAVSIIALAIVIASVLFKNYIFAVLILLATLTLMLSVSTEPKEIDVTVDNRGIRLNKSFFDYKSMESFWVENDSIPPKILIKSTKLFSPLLIIPIYDFSPEEIRSILIDFLKEESLHEPLMHKLMDFLGF